MREGVLLLLSPWNWLGRRVWLFGDWCLRFGILGAFWGSVIRLSAECVSVSVSVSEYFVSCRRCRFRVDGYRSNC